MMSPCKTVFIQDYQNVVQACFLIQTAHSQGVDFIAVDTEFVRRDTYFPQLSLIQIGIPEYAFVFDVLSLDSDSLSLIHTILYSEDLIKVIHAARQDCEAFLHIFQKIPHPLLDTQIAYALLYCDSVIGYEMAVHKLLGVHVDKTCQTSQWLLRPLTEQQIQYAANDVIQLCPLYETLKERLIQTNRLDWAVQESRVFLDQTLYEVDSLSLWKKFPFSPQQWPCAVAAKYLMAWREEQAIQLNKPKGHIISDQSLFTIACHINDHMDINLIIQDSLKYSKRLSLHILEENNLIPSLQNVVHQVKELCLHMTKSQKNQWIKSIKKLQIRDYDEFHGLKVRLSKICKECARKNSVSSWLFCPQSEMKIFIRDLLKTKKLWITKSKLARSWRKTLLNSFEEQIMSLLCDLKPHIF